MFNPQAYANSKPGGVAVLEVVPAPTPGVTSPLFVPLKRTVVGGRWDGPLAEVTVTHTYGYTKAECAKTLEALYRFPLPGDAAVRRVVVTFGDVEIVAELKARKQAEQEYEAAREAGQQAALVTREAPDVFTLKVTGLKPDEEVVVETTYVQVAQAQGAGFVLRVPLTVAPRYSRSDEPSAREARPLRVARDPGHRVLLDILTDGIGQVTSPTHVLDLEEEDDHVRIRLRDREAVPDRDCVLVWQPLQADVASLHVLLSVDKDSVDKDSGDKGYTYFLALVAPPKAPATRLARESIALVDHSGSMSGPKREAADWAAAKFLGDLAPADRYNLGVFDTNQRWLDQRPRAAGENAVAEGKRFLGAALDGGGTELGVALEQALRQARTSGEASRHVVIVTDAQVSDFARILRLVDEEATRPDRRRVSVLCVDAAPNSFLALELARRGGGIARFVTSSPEEGDVTTALSEILESFDQPIMTGLRLEVNREGVEAPERTAVPAGEPGWSAVDLGDLYAGHPTWIAGRVPSADAQSIAFRLAGTAGEVETWRTRAQAVGPAALRALFGAWKVLGLESLVGAGWPDEEARARLAALGYDPSVLPAAGGRRAVYHENAVKDLQAVVENLLLKEALEYGLLCSVTGFVAVRKEKGEPVEESVVVSSALPSGWPDSFRMASMAGAPVMHNAMLRAMPAPQASAMPPSAQGRRPLGMGRAMQFRGARAPDAAVSRPVSSGDEPEDLAGDAHAPTSVVLFRGAPSFSGPEAVLFDSARPDDAAKLPPDAAFSRLRLALLAGKNEPAKLDASVELLVYVGDLAAPAVRVRVADLLRQGGERPVQIARRGGEAFRVVLSDPKAIWARSASGGLEVSLS